MVVTVIVVSYRCPGRAKEMLISGGNADRAPMARGFRMGRPDRSSHWGREGRGGGESPFGGGPPIRRKDHAADRPIRAISLPARRRSAGPCPRRPCGEAPGPAAPPGPTSRPGRRAPRGAGWRGRLPVKRASQLVQFANQSRHFHFADDRRPRAPIERAIRPLPRHRLPKPRPAFVLIVGINIPLPGDRMAPSLTGQQMFLHERVVPIGAWVRDERRTARRRPTAAAADASSSTATGFAHDQAVERVSHRRRQRAARRAGRAIGGSLADSSA